MEEPFVQLGLDLEEAVAVAGSNGVGWQVKVLGDFSKGEAMPDLQDDDLTLVEWEFLEAGNCGFLPFVHGSITFEPPLGLHFPEHSAEEAASIIDGAVPKGAKQIGGRILGAFFQVEERMEAVLHHIFGLEMAQTQGSPIKDETIRLALEEILCPLGVHFCGHRH